MVVHRARINRNRTISCNTHRCRVDCAWFWNPWSLAKGAVCRDKLERCVLHETQVVDERRVPLFEAKRKFATLAYAVQ